MYLMRARILIDLGLDSIIEHINSSSYIAIVDDMVKIVKELTSSMESPSIFRALFSTMPKIEYGIMAGEKLKAIRNYT